jgi:phage-related tail fiber protein
VLVWQQSTASENGIYVSAAGAWTRATDFDTSAEVFGGAIVGVSEGAINAPAGSAVFQLATDDPITIGVTGLTFINITVGAAGLAGVLAIGNTTGARDIDITSGQAIDYQGEINIQRQGTTVFGTASAAMR